MSGLTGTTMNGSHRLSRVNSGLTVCPLRPLRRQRRSRSQTRSIARRHTCEQNRCSGDRRWRTILS
jgi:hypothetical protein